MGDATASSLARARAGRPDNAGYGGVAEADVPELVERHLIGGEPVEILRIEPEDFAD